MSGDEMNTAESGYVQSGQPWQEEMEQERADKTVTRWADKAMYPAEPIDAKKGPKVYLISVTPDPLGNVAAAALYEGYIHRSLADISDEERMHYFEQLQKTHLKAAFEFVDFHFFIEGVTRGFTHQMVRQRTATFIQESTRFAVKEDMPVGLPPSLAGTEKLGQGDNQALGAERDQDTWKRNVWDVAANEVREAYEHLIDAGMPAEDARGLLPTNLLTRIHYKTNLRNLLEHAGNRLCTQAQFEWRLVFAQIAQAIRNYGRTQTYATDLPAISCHGKDVFDSPRQALYVLSARWQFELIADMFRPICYATGKCEFKASFDRACNIRDRVDANHEAGRPPLEWGRELRSNGESPDIGAINPAEWLLDPGAAR